MRMKHASALLLLAAALAAPRPSPAQEAPAGFDAYTVVEFGVPVFLRVEGDRIVGSDDPRAMVRVVEGRIAGEDVSMTLESPNGPARFVGKRFGDQFAGIVLEESERRQFFGVHIVPAGESPAAPDEATDPSFYARAPGISRIEIVPADVTLQSQERRRFVARAFDESGAEIAAPAVEWYAAGGTITGEGEFWGINPGDRVVLALVDGAMAVTDVTIADPPVVSLSLFTDVPARLAAGSRVPLEVDAVNAIGSWVLDPALEATSSDPAVAEVVDEVLVAKSPGRATVTLAADEASERFEVQVVAASGSLAITGGPDGPVRTGDVVRLGTTVPDARPIWAVSETGAEAYADGAFVAEDPGTYTVLATLGDEVATATIRAEPRGPRGRIRIVGHGENLETFTSDLWPQGGYVYLGTHMANQLRTYDVSDPENPVLTDTQEFDARVVNDVKVSPDGRWLVATREGAADRRNGILVFSLADPARPALVSEYTETLTAGVHNVFWHGPLVYAVNDGTGDMHVVDLSDPESPAEVGRWGLDAPGGYSLHDVWVQDGVAYLSYLGHGLAVLDVGGGGMGGTPTEPVLVSRIYYPAGPTHTAMRYGDYVFVGDEDFSLQGTVPQFEGIGSADPRGPIHVIDVSDLAEPRYAATYEVPEAGAHNIWIDEEEGILYIGYYQGGIRAVDVSGELRGDLYAQGREIAYFLPAAGPDEARVPFAPMTWGVFPMFGDGWTADTGTFYASDYNSGLWAFRLDRSEGD